jgi:hypothetical protein
VNVTRWHPRPQFHITLPLLKEEKGQRRRKNKEENGGGRRENWEARDSSSHNRSIGTKEQLGK